MKLDTLFDSLYLDSNEESFMMSDQSEYQPFQVTANDLRHEFKTDAAHDFCFLKTCGPTKQLTISRVTFEKASVATPIIHCDVEQTSNPFRFCYPSKLTHTSAACS